VVSVGPWWLRIRQFGGVLLVFQLNPSLPLHHLELNIGTVAEERALDVKRVAGGWGNLRQSMGWRTKYSTKALGSVVRSWDPMQTSPVHKAGKIAVLLSRRGNGCETSTCWQLQFV